MMTPKQELLRRSLLSLAHDDYAKGLSSYAFYKLKDRAAGEDAVQDSFLKTWKYLIKEGKIQLMRAFLYHVLNNIIIDEYRKKKLPSLDVLLENGYEPAKEDPTEHLVNMLDGKAAIILLKQLPEPYRKVIYMRYIQDLSLHEMSLLTGQSKNTLAVQLHRGIAKLKVLYQRSPR
ncbi:MAG: sigma-70 family RNA polymerase sigma factor [Patescibacteria group bacterium]